MGKVPEAKQKTERPVTQDRLFNAAVFYLGRYESTQTRLTQVLKRKVQRWTGENDVSSFEPMVAGVVERCVRLDLVDDARFARMRSAALSRRGKAARTIAQDLKARGIAADVIETVLSDFGQSEDKAAIVSLAKRRRLGMFRSQRQADKRAADPRKWHDKELGILLRAGHSYPSAAQFLACSEDADLLDWLDD